MVDRVNSNRKNVSAYVTGSPLGTSSQDCSALTAADKDKCEWNNALFGAAELKGTETLGAMIGARGCITNPRDDCRREIVVAVAWQGLRPTVVPGGTNCGQNLYGTDDRLRRAMIARVMIGCLQNDPVHRNMRNAMTQRRASSVCRSSSSWSR